MSTFIFDTKNKKEYFSEINFDVFAPDFKYFKSANQNETLIEIISNVAKIEQEIDLLIENIKKDNVNTQPFLFNVNTDNLKKISFLFSHLRLMADEYVEKKKKNLEGSIAYENDYIKSYKEEIKELYDAIKNNTVTEEDKYEFIFDIEEKFHEKFPKQILDIYLNSQNYEFLNDEEKKLQDNNAKIEDEYILKTYSKEYKDYIHNASKDYLKCIKLNEQHIKKSKAKISKYKKELKTICFDSYIAYLLHVKYVIQYTEYQVRALNCIDYEDDTFKWQEISREERLCLANIYANPFKIDLDLPKSKIVYALEENDAILPLSQYASTALSSNKNKPYINIMKNFLNKNLIELHQYSCNDIVEIISVLFYEYKILNIQINKCQNCGKYFVPQIKSNEKYCNRVSPQNKNKTCKQFGVNKTYRDEMKSTPIKNEHNRISQFYRMRIKRAKEENVKEKYRKDFNIYMQNYQKRKSDYKDNKLSEKAFMTWLKTQKGGELNGNT